MTINHIVTKLIKNKNLIPICIIDDCRYIKLNNEWTDNYNHKKLIRIGYIYPNLTGSACDNHFNNYMNNKNKV